MLIIKDFKDNAEAMVIIEDMTSRGAILKEVQNHFDGNHLIFEGTERDLGSEIDELKLQVEDLARKVVKTI